MAASKEERKRILALLEAGQINAEQAAQLLDALDVETQSHEHSQLRQQERILRLHVSSTGASGKRNAPTHLTATLPLRLLRVGLRLGSSLVPQLSAPLVEELLHTVESGARGRLLDLHDLERGERLEIFVE